MSAAGGRVGFRRLLGAAALALGLSSMAERAGAQSVRVGDRVRVWVPALQAEGVTGTVTKIDGDRIELAGTSYGDGWTFAANGLSRAELSLGVGDRGHEMRRGMIIGGIAGFVAGLGYGLGTSCQDEDVCKLQTRELVVGIVAGTTVGALGGALVGAVRAREAWVPLDLPLRLALTPVTRSWTVGVALSW